MCRGGLLEPQLTLSFTNAGGLPAGGSIAIIDLEFEASTVMINAFSGGNPVSPNWQVAFYQVAGVNVAPPVWNPGTRTLTGSGESSGTVNNFVFLVSDIQIDSLVFAISAPSGDGIGFATSKSSIPQPVPEPATLGLLCAGLVLSLPRRSKPRDPSLRSG